MSSDRAAAECNGRARAASAGVQIDWIREDARSWRPSRQFQGALLLFQSLGFYTDPLDDLRVLRTLRSSLAPGGIAVVADLVPCGLLEAEGVPMWAHSWCG